MSRVHRIPPFFFTVLILTLHPSMYGQDRLLRDLPASATYFTVTPASHDSIFQLPHQFIVERSDSIVVDTSIVLKRDVEYTIDYRHGRIQFDSLFVHSKFRDTLTHHTVTVMYQYLPFKFEDTYFRRKLVALKDSTGRDTLRVSKPRTSFGLDDIFGQNLQKSGSIVRGFTVGSNRDFTLNSGLRLQLAGKLSSEIDLVAALTDENTPLQPEGTSQTLQEFDKVFVELRSRNAVATLGDFNLDFTGTEFARLSRKLQGASVAAEYQVGGMGGASKFAAASTRGKFNTNQFQGLEAVQGPYRLVGRNNERQIIIIAGTERVYVNGELQTRGEPNDYTIDYANGEVTFTARRLITSASRITVDFEYTDRQFSRSLLAGQTSASFFDDKAKFTFSYLREADDPDAPIDFSFSDSARSVLQRAGDDRSKAFLDGVTRVDSNGFYIPDSALVNGILYRFYRYAPGRSALFVITFTSVPFGQGDYVRQAVGNFVWKGPGQGDYRAVKILPLPQSSQVMDFNLDLAPIGDVKIGGEFGISRFDENRLSSLDDGNNTGHALSFEGSYAPRDVQIAGKNIGSFDLRLKERYVSGRFVPVDRTNDIEFNRKWGIESITQTNEEIQEASLRYLPTNSIGVGVGYGKIVRGENLRSSRNEASVNIKGDSFPTVDYSLENVVTRESLLDNNSKWLRQLGSVEYQTGIFTPFFKYENENRRIRFLSNDSVKSGSFGLNAYSPGLRVRDFWNMSLSAQLEFRTDNKFLNGTVLRESKSITQIYNWRLAEWNTLTSAMDVTFRSKQFSQVFKALGNKDIQTVLVRNQTRVSPFNRAFETDLFYEVATERSSRLERVFIQVPVGTGNYKYLGDLNQNGVFDENEFTPARFDGEFIAVTVPSDELYPVIDLKTSARVRVTPGRLISQPQSVVEDILSIMTTESYARVEEKSSEPDLKKISLLHFSRFQSDSTIVGSTLFSQDINLFEGRPEFSLRMRYSQRKGIARYASSSSGGLRERSFVRERSLRLRWQLVSEIVNQIDFVHRNDRVTSTEASSRLRNITSNSGTFDMSYRPYQNIEVGMKIEVGSSADAFPSPELSADMNTQSVRIVYAFQGAGQARVEASREEVLLSRAIDVFPFELTGGRVAGKTFLWRLACDYRVTHFIQATLNYDGRTEGGRSPVHTARAEVRAFF